MRTLWFIFSIMLLPACALADVSCIKNLFKAPEFEAVEEKSSSGEVHLSIGAEPMRFAATCVSGQRSTFVHSADFVELRADFFENGSVRQYVVKACGEEVGTIKVEHGGFDIDSQYSQPRLSLYSDGRIVGEIANAENQETFFFVRNSASHIIGRGKRGGDGQWKVSSDSIPPLMNAMLLFASRMERHSCEAVAERWLQMRGLVFGVSTAAFVVTCYYIFKRLRV